MNKSMRHIRRWPASLAVVAVLILQLLVPTQIAAFPRWVMPALGALLLLPLIWMNPFHLRRDEPWLRWVELALLAVLVLANAIYLAELIVYLNSGDANNGLVLVKAAALIWVTNVVAFGVWYWEVDRGGPFARAPEHEREAERADLLFPQMTVDLPGWDRWLPGFTDYLFVAFTAATAFSPTDTMPLTARVKVLMAIQSAIALLTIAVVAARAVNVL
ncbi:hypothetical protein HPO96_01500 [Kribbella sandramycini]|uniref:DUF1345 domain-containing protein n=1 Tax=Kribbella sandramycini TaxID=60450 RepID=A0A7Y4KWF1_9ACTN|nr:hypothetical protein [Kribbella sandramycini]MBB6568501.1 hypothetical protein [Kribbella sandramycini]NOL38911.1 hypothetical protein [Kribbella sandramycini]